jgi:hypothetical protein
VGIVVVGIVVVGIVVVGIVVVGIVVVSETHDRFRLDGDNAGSGC